MNAQTRLVNTVIATAAVFAGSLLSDAYFGDGIQIDDFEQALVVAAIAGVLQFWLGRRMSHDR